MNGPFMGEGMRCIICDRRERSHPGVESNWRCLEVNDRRYYACPDEFPPDGSTKDAFRQAYEKILDIVLKPDTRP